MVQAVLREDIPGVVGLVSGHLLPPSYNLTQDRGDDMTYRDTTTPAILHSPLYFIILLTMVKF